MSKRKKAAPLKRTKRPIAPIAPPAPIPDPAVIDEPPQDQAAAPPCSLDYIYADIWSEVPPCCTDFPNGARGYIVVGTGDKWARLFSPVTLACHKLPIDFYDGLKLHVVRFDPVKMLERLKKNREQARHYGWFDGGKAADEGEACILRALVD